MNNKSIIIFVAMLLLILGLSIFLLIDKDDKIDIGDPRNNASENKEDSSSNNNDIKLKYKDQNEKRKTLSVVTDYDEFFTVNYYINNMYQKLDSGDYDTVLDLLDEDYKNLNRADKNNVGKLITDNVDISFISHNIYTKGKDNILYYFIDGEEHYTNFISGGYSSKENVYYLLTLDEETSNYNIRPLKVENIFNYAQNFNLNVKKEVTGKNHFVDKSINDEKISLTYLNYFKSLLITNPQKAYSMLNEQSKAKYNGYNDFENSIGALLNEIPSTIFSYSAKGNDGSRYYSIICTNKKVIEFEEKGIMDFKVIL